LPRVSAALSERTIEVGGIRTFLRERAGEGPPAVFVHGNPTSSHDWIPFMERLSGPALAFDLPGFGRSERPDQARFDYTLGAYADFIERLLDELTPGGYSLLVHDWGGVALAAAQRHPERVRRLVVVNAVPLNGSYRWHWIARIWRRRGLGELLNATTTRFAFAQILRLARPGGKPMPEDVVDDIWANWDRRVSRAVLALYRSADPLVLALAGRRLGTLDCPALVAWGDSDPFIGLEQGRWYARVLPGAELEVVERAGHWPWIDRPELVERVCGFLEPDR
jgi:pimeloyl-ACP methyl ester carboxylesterase